MRRGAPVGGCCANSCTTWAFLRAVKLASHASHSSETGSSRASSSPTTTSTPVDAREVLELGVGERRLRGAAAAEHHDLLDAAGAQRLERVVGDVGGGELVGGLDQQARHVGGDVAVADHDRARAREVGDEVAVVGVAVVPADQLGGRQAPGQVLAGDPQRLVGARADRVDDRVVVAHEVLVGDVLADLDVAEEPAAGAHDLLVEELGERLDLLVVGRDAVAQQTPRRGQPLEDVDLGALATRRSSLRGGVGAGGPGPDDRDPQRPHRSWKNSALTAAA